MNRHTFTSSDEILLRLSDAADLRAERAETRYYATRRLDSFIMGMEDSQRRIAALLRRTGHPLGEPQPVG